MNGITPTYTFSKPALRPVLLDIMLTSSGIQVFSFREENQKSLIQNLPYSELQSVNITWIDVNNTQLFLSFSSGDKIEINSFSTAKLQDGKVKPDGIDQTAAFNRWVSDLHQLLIARGLSGSIRFTEGSDTKQIILILLLGACLVGIFAAWKIELIGIAALLAGGALMVSATLFKSGFSKGYLPESKILPDSSAATQPESH